MSSSLLHSQISFPLESLTSSNKNTSKTRPCVARLYNKKTHFINLVSKPTSLPNLSNNCSIEKWKARDSGDESGDVSPEFLPSSPSPVHIVHEFYEAFNKKDTETLKLLLSPECVYQDLLFYSAYEGQEVSFFQLFLLFHDNNNMIPMEWYWRYFHSNFLYIFFFILEHHTLLAKRDGCNGSKHSCFCGRCQGDQPCYGDCVYAPRFVTHFQSLT